MNRTLGTLTDAEKRNVCRMFLSVPDPRHGYVNRHRHTEVEIGLILSGEGRYDTPHGQESFGKGDMFLFGANEPHNITDIDPSPGESEICLLNLHFSPSFVWDRDPGMTGSGYLAVFLDPAPDFKNLLPKEHPSQGKLVFLMNEIRSEFENGLPDREARIRLLLTELLIVLHRDYYPQRDAGVRISSGHARSMELALRYMHANFAGEIRLTDIAKEAYMPPNYFCTVFRRMNGMTVWQYINILRIDRACELLETTDETVLAVALASGYKATAGFNRIFRAVTGLTPSEYRLICRGAPDGKRRK